MSEWQFLLDILKEEFPLALWETLYVTLVSTGVATLIGFPLGVLLAGIDGGYIRFKGSKVLTSTLNLVINFLRSVPFLILMILVLPLSRLVVGTTIGTEASVVPLIVAAFPFIARLIEGSLKEVDKGVIEAAQSMGATTPQLICRFVIPEAVPSIINKITLSLTTVLGFTAMSGMLGGGGIGKIAINYGYYRYRYLVMYAAVIILVLLVILIQFIGDRLSYKLDRRIK